MPIDTPFPAPEPLPLPLGEVIAERRFTLYEAAGGPKQICVRIGRPVPAAVDGNVSAAEQSIFRCPLQITGLDCDERVFAPAGTDSVMALQSAIFLAGGVLDGATQRLNLLNPLAMVRERHNPGGPHFEDVGPSSWLWHYDSHPGTDYGLQLG